MSTSILQFDDRILGVSSLNAYIQSVNQVPLLTLEEEQELANKLRYYHDLDAARKLVLSHLRVVVKIARGYAGYGLPQADLIQEGNIGLMKAVKRFDPSIGVRLVSFAIHWIRAEMHEFILRNWRIVKIATTKAQRKLFFGLRKQAKNRGWFSDEEAETVACLLKVSTKDVRLMEQRLSSYDETLEVDDRDGETGEASAHARYLEDKRYNPETLLEQHDMEQDQFCRLHAALDGLDARSRDIITQRFLLDDKATLLELSEKYNVSVERVRQIQDNAMRKMRTAIGTHER